MAHNVTIRFDFSDTSKYASIPLYIGVSATFTTIFIYIQSELSPLRRIVSNILDNICHLLGETEVGSCEVTWEPIPVK